MATLTDGFPGVALDLAWSVTDDTPTVSGGELSLAPGGVGAFGLTHSSLASGTELTASILIDMSDTPTTAVGVDFGSVSVIAAWVSSFGLLTVDSGGDSNFAVATALTGRYILQVTMDATNTVATIADEATPGTPIYTATVATSSAAITALAAGMNPTLVGTAGTSTWDDFFLEADVITGEAPPPPEVLHGPGLIFSLTTLRYPDSDPYPGGLEPLRKWRLTQFTDGEVVIPLDDIREARVTISVYDPACVDILPLERFLHVRYQGQVVFWGPLTDPEWDLPNGTVTINALGPEYRLAKHFVRIGDTIGAETVSEDEELDLELTSDGMWDLVVCGENTAGQTTRGVPDLGIERHPSLQGDGGSTSVIKTQRSDQVFGKLTQIAESLLGPDFEFIPQELDQGSYAQFATYEKQGTDRSDEIHLHYGWGLDNLDGWVSRPSGSSVVTHRHTVSSDGHNRGTAAAEGPSARFGPYVEWDTINGNAEDDVLAEIGRGTVLAYGEPPEFLDVAMKVAVDGTPTWHYGVDYEVGDIITAAAHKGFYRRSLLARITKVTLSQTSSLLSTLPTLELVPRILTDEDVDSPED